MVKHLTMGWFGTTHTRIIEKALEYFTNLDENIKVELMAHINDPDRELPNNFMNHIQTPDGYGNAKNSIIDNYNIGEVLNLSHALHYLQDICNPLHTLRDYPINKHIIYELMISKTILILGSHNGIFDGGLASGIDKVVKVANGFSHKLTTAIDCYRIDDIMDVSQKSLTLATYATIDLLKISFGNHEQ